MDIVDVRITEGGGTEVLKMLHRFDPTVPIGELKRRLTEHDTAVSFDLDSYDWLANVDTGVTAHEYELNFYGFLESLAEKGAVLSVGINGTERTMEYLREHIETRNGIREDVENYPD